MFDAVTREICRSAEALWDDLRDCLEKISLRLRALAALLGGVEKNLPMTKTGFYTDQDKQVANEAVCRWLSEHGALLPDFQALASALLAFDGRITEIDATIVRAVALHGDRTDRALSDARKRLEQTARICKALQPCVTRFCFTDLPNFYTRIEKNVDFEGDGADCMPQMLVRACIDLRRAATDLNDHILNVDFL